jgi:hypothetical protein
VRGKLIGTDVFGRGKLMGTGKENGRRFFVTCVLVAVFVVWKGIGIETCLLKWLRRSLLMMSTGSGVLEEMRIFQGSQGGGLLLRAWLLLRPGLCLPLLHFRDVSQPTRRVV